MKTEWIQRVLVKFLQLTVLSVMVVVTLAIFPIEYIIMGALWYALWCIPWDLWKVDPELLENKVRKCKRRRTPFLPVR